MTPELQQHLIGRALAHLAAGTSDLAPDEVTGSVDAYLSAERFAREQQALFRNQPLALGPRALVPQSGDFLTTNDHRFPLLVTRGPDGGLHAMLNACTHRGARLVSESGGSRRQAFVCPYHGWTYGHDGQLRHATHPECFPGLDRSVQGLVTLPVQEQAGLIWVQRNPTPADDLRAFLGGLAPDLTALSLDTHVPGPGYERVVAANWKLVVDSFLEDYHIPFVHNETVSQVVTGKVMVWDAFGRHQRLVQPGPGLQALAAVPPRRWRLRPVAAICYFVFPNTALFVNADHVVWFRVDPLDVGSTRVRWTLLIPETAQSEALAAHWERHRRLGVAGLEEDLGAVERVQAGLQAGLLLQVRRGRNEVAVQAFHATIDSVPGMTP
ncbi:MAG: aromatic ring-hydroxylating dioxygenase subunit alpha [Candidatus Sericytochromatia bacterium]|nr:aromatic ring-hydroxylating dioxygenase subunit alpha [Candidatus Sericytochromatia bacterium]